MSKGPVPEDSDAPNEEPAKPSDVQPTVQARSAEQLPSIEGITLTGEIARGGMGVVYRGRQDYLNRQVAVKVLAEKLQDDTFAERFKREAQILAGIQQRNIVACHQAGINDRGQCFLVMELVDGQDLMREVIANGPLDPTRALLVCRDLCQALRHAYTKGIIHRDVKPENVLLAATPLPDSELPWGVKLADLGLARVVEGDEPDPYLTAPGSFIGTPATMAPEQFDASEVDFRADIYGVGCVLFYAIAGQMAYPSKPLIDVVKAKGEPLGPHLSERGVAVEEGVANLIQRMLAADPDDRPASYDELIAEIEELAADDEDLATIPMARPARGAAPTPPSKTKLIVGILAVIVCIAGGVWGWQTFVGGNPAKITLPTIVYPTECRALIPIGLKVDLGDFDDEGLTYLWKNESGLPGSFEDPRSAATRFTLQEFTEETDVKLSLTITAKGNDPIKCEARLAARIVDLRLFGDKSESVKLWQGVDSKDKGNFGPGEDAINGFCHREFIACSHEVKLDTWRFTGTFESVFDGTVQPERVSIILAGEDPNDRVMIGLASKEKEKFELVAATVSVDSDEKIALGKQLVAESRVLESEEKLRFVVVRSIDEMTLVLTPQKGQPLAPISVQNAPKGPITIWMRVDGKGLGYFRDFVLR